MVNGCPIIAREHTCNGACMRFEMGRSRRPQEGLRSRNKPRQKDPPRQSGDLGICKNGTLSQDGQKSYDIELELVELVGTLEELHHG